MCVDTQEQAWERPAVSADIPLLAQYFPGIDFPSLLAVMSRDGAKPLTTDLTLIGAMLSTAPDDLGMGFVPFAGLHQKTGAIVKLPVMAQIVAWFENSALGTDMWHHASDWSQQRHGGQFHFAMDCGCGFVSARAKQNGQWQAWQQRFNASRADVYGRTRVVWWTTNSLVDLDITPTQLSMWLRMRAALAALPRLSVAQVRQATQSDSLLPPESRAPLAFSTMGYPRG